MTADTQKGPLIYLEGLIQAYEAAGFAVGLHIEKDRVTTMRPFKGGKVMVHCSLPLNYQHKDVERLEESVWDAHVAALNPTPTATAADEGSVGDE